MHLYWVGRSTSEKLRFVGLVTLAVGVVLPSWGNVRDPFPDPGPVTRAAALAVVADGATSPQGCLTLQIQALGAARLVTSTQVRRALLLLQQPEYFGIDRSAFAAEGTRIAYSVEPSAFDRINSVDRDEDGRPDLLQDVTMGLDQARQLLVHWLGLPAPQGVEVVLLELGTDHTGYLVTADSRPGRVVIVLDSSASDPGTARHAAIHQYAHAVALAAGPRMPREWGEALATWATLFLDGTPDPVTAGLLSTRLERLDQGLLSQDPELAAGNAIWLSFLEEAYGPAAVSVTVLELAQGGAVEAALGRALDRVSGDDLAAAFREFHLWSILVGSRADRFHFSFADRMAEPRFASEAFGLPALSVQADPAIAPWGATQVRIVPDSHDGGLDLRFEGELTAGWEADLLLIDETGILRRLAIDVSNEGWGHSTVPLDGVAEALLLLRNVGSEDAAAHRYTYAAHRVRGFPFEISTLEARPTGAASDGIDVTWETTSESRLIGFNVLRVRENGGSEVVVNPVWIPALGDRGRPTSYHFQDRDVDPDASYIYRVQGITSDGLTSTSDPVVARRPDAH
jgi:hypothetical protein